MHLSEELDYKLLCILGDGQPHTWVETVYLGVYYLKVPQPTFEKLLQRAVVDNNWVYRLSRAPILREDFLQLTSKGDQYLRYLSTRRGGDYSYYKYFNRSEHSGGFGQHGLDKYAPLPQNLQKIPPTNGH